MFILSAFSINMLDLSDTSYSVKFSAMTEEDARKTLQENAFESFIGHEGTASVLSSRLGQDIAFNRTNVLLGAGDFAIVCQLPRPKEGQVYAEEEVASMKIAYIFVEVDAEISD